MRKPQITFICGIFIICCSLYMNRVMYLNRVEKYYYGYDEWGRLERHRVEFELTKRALDRYISPNSSVIDVGGGPGRYSIYLT